jgi:hypothetical protein
MKHNQTKVRLSAYELELVTNAKILLTKNEIIKKVYELFGFLANEFVEEAKNILPGVVAVIPPKISRGENYQGLPYVMLDYPRYFKKDKTFAIRTFFWWGNFFSIALQLSGEYKHFYLDAVNKAIKNKELQGWYVGIGNNPWEHHFESNNYKIIEEAAVFGEGEILKLAIKIPLKEWDQAQLFFQKQFAILINVLKH